MAKNLINLLYLAAVVFGISHYMTQQTMDSVKAVLVPRIQGLSEEAGIHVTQDSDNNQASDLAQPAGGMAVIPVRGILVPRRGQITAMCSEFTSHECIRSQVYVALNDPSINEIVLDINSGGDAAVGCKELTDYTFQSRQTKPITAIVNYSVYSAAYLVASVCSKIVASQTSGVGSIGVIMEHLDTFRMEEQMGLTFTMIFRGDNKSNGTQHEPLSEDARGMFQRMIDDMHEALITSVAEYRNLAPQMVINTQAGIYSGADSTFAGLADEVPGSQSTINAIAAKYKQPQQTTSIKLQVVAMNLRIRM